jgi:hypothetical protein
MMVGSWRCTACIQDGGAVGTVAGCDMAARQTVMARSGAGL